MRKFWFAYPARALVVFPGGFGTMDELFEMLTLMQTRKIESKVILILYGTEYWRRVVNFQALVEFGTIAAEDLSLLQEADDPRSGFTAASGWPDKVLSQRGARPGERTRDRDTAAGKVSGLIRCLGKRCCPATAAPPQRENVSVNLDPAVKEKYQGVRMPKLGSDAPGLLSQSR